jgi:hypothetical protein
MAKISGRCRTSGPIWVGQNRNAENNRQYEEASRPPSASRNAFKVSSTVLPCRDAVLTDHYDQG